MSRDGPHPASSVRRTDRDQLFDRAGNVVSENVREVVEFPTAGPHLVRLPAGRFHLPDQALDVSTSIVGSGVGVTTLVVAPNARSSLRIVSADVRIADLTVEGSGDSANLANYGTAVKVESGAQRVTVERVRAVGLAVGFSTHQASDVVFRDCSVDGAYNYGFDINNADGVTMDNCHANACRLDGFKLRRSTSNCTVRGGSSRRSVDGDGLDAYAGGESLLIDGLVAANNGINGVTIKTDALTDTDPELYGYVRRVVMTGVRCQGNVGHGFTVHRGGTTDRPTYPLVNAVDFVGCHAVSNGLDGVVVRARNVSMFGGYSAFNGRHGIRVDAAAFDVDLHGVTVAANSQATPNVWDGINISGTHVNVVGGRSLGAEADDVVGVSTMDGASAHQRYGLRVEPTANHVKVDGLAARHNVTGDVSNAAKGSTAISVT